MPRRSFPARPTYLETVVRGIANRYPIDGVHFDYARYPNARFDYSRLAIAEFRTAVRPRLDDALRRQLDAREKVDLFAYPDALPDDWRAFRVARMTALMRRLRAAVKAERPDALVTVATKPDLREAYDDRLQDWGAWLHDGHRRCRVSDGLHAGSGALRRADRRGPGGGERPADLGRHRRLPAVAAQTVDNIQTARRLGAAGVILFSYDSLTDPKLAAPDYLEKVGARGVPSCALRSGLALTVYRGAG